MSRFLYPCEGRGPVNFLSYQQKSLGSCLRRSTMSVLHPPRRKAPRFARLVKEDDVAVGIAQPRFAPHPRLVPRPMLERHAAAGELLDALVEIVTLEIDGGGRDDLLLGVDLHRESRSAGGFEARIIGRIVDD